MILYQLQCRNGHQFEGWFRDSASFDKQKQQGLILCSRCGDSDIDKAIMAPSVNSERRNAGTEATDKSSLPSEPSKNPREKAIASLRAHFEKEGTYVGPDFPVEARKIHFGETKERLIYGQATVSEVKDLHDDGIAVAPLPFTVRRDS